MGSIAREWRDLSGQSNWKGMLLNIDLRRYIIHYGQLAQATYDAFNSEKASKCAGNCRYTKRDFFSKVGLEHGNPFKYDVTKFLYATSKASVPEAFILKSFSKDAWSLESNWIGYVAVATDEGKAALGRRDIVVDWRGTVQAAEWVKDVHFHLVPAAPIIIGDARAKVHHGFYSIYTSNKPGSKFTETSARNQVLEEVRRVVDEHKNEEISITVTGHSLGAALASDFKCSGHSCPWVKHTRRPKSVSSDSICVCRLKYMVVNNRDIALVNKSIDACSRGMEGTGEQGYGSTIRWYFEVYGS